MKSTSSTDEINILAKKAVINSEGESYVHKKNKEVIVGYIRLLKESNNWGLLKNEDFASRIEQTLSLNDQSQFSELFVSALLRYLMPFLSVFEHSPTWLKLINRGLGLRKISTDYRQSIEMALLGVGLPSLGAISKKTVTCPALAYNLSLYELAESLLVDKNDSSSEYIKKKIYLRTGGKIDTNEKDLRVRVIALLESFRQFGAEDNLQLLNALDLSLKLDERNAEEQLVKIHCLNSLNYPFLQSKDYESVVGIFAEVERLSLLINDIDLKNHVLGNLNYQKGIVANTQDNLSEAKSFFQKSILHEPDFFDSNYRLASLLHDSMDPVAETYYLAAIAYSPCSQAIINDYGCFLSETNSPIAAEYEKAFLATFGSLNEDLN